MKSKKFNNIGSAVNFYNRLKKSHRAVSISFVDGQHIVKYGKKR